jgi:hypothetical protein
MGNWINYPATLSGEIVDLVSLEKTHFPELDRIAKDRRIWEHYAFDGSNTPTLLNMLESSLIEQENGTQFPFIIFHTRAHKIIRRRSVSRLVLG